MSVTWRLPHLPEYRSPIKPVSAEASASAAFPEKTKRIGVAAAGMMVEMFLAALALFVWLNVEEGQVSAIAYNVMLVGGVSTILFNGNPLLRFDGYYVLQDLIEIPNLGKRSKDYLGYLLKRYAFGLQDSKSPATDSGEKIWFVGYGLISFCYRIFNALLWRQLAGQRIFESCT